jgi:5-formyltetrahydrofolate cyclo-ligase
MGGEEVLVYGNDISRAKTLIRLQGRAARRAITPEVKAAAEHAIAQRVAAIPEVLAARGVLAYAPLAEEVGITALVKWLRVRGTRLALPRVVGSRDLALHWVEDGDELALSSFGVPEPLASASAAAPRDLEVALVPGIAFDVDGYRVGFGAGYYDRQLDRIGERVVAIGLAYDEQVHAEVPRTRGDERLNLLVTPTRTLRFAAPPITSAT